MENTKDLNYWKDNCEEDYLNTPISVLRYITELEKEVERKALNLPVVVRQSEQLVCPRCNNEPLYNKYDDVVACTMCEK